MTLIFIIEYVPLFSLLPSDHSGYKLSSPHSASALLTSHPQFHAQFPGLCDEDEQPCLYLIRILFHPQSQKITHNFSSSLVFSGYWYDLTSKDNEVML